MKNIDLIHFVLLIWFMLTAIVLGRRRMILNEFDGSKERATYRKMAEAIGVTIPGYMPISDVPGFLIVKMLERVVDLEKRIKILEDEKKMTLSDLTEPKCA